MPSAAAGRGAAGAGGAAAQQQQEQHWEDSERRAGPAEHGGLGAAARAPVPGVRPTDRAERGTTSCFSARVAAAAHAPERPLRGEGGGRRVCRKK